MSTSHVKRRPASGDKGSGGVGARPTPPSDVSRRSVLAWAGLLVPVVVIVAIVVAGTANVDGSAATVDGQAVEFSLPTTVGTTVSLDEILAEGDALLYFSMGVGCDGCFAQIPEAEQALAERGISLVPIMVDDPAMVHAAASRFGIETPILIDADRAVSDAYGMLGVYGHADRPSHSFALVRKDGNIDWVKHYATMFVPGPDLVRDLESRA